MGHRLGGQVLHIVGCLRWPAVSCEYLSVEIYNQEESLQKEEMKASFMRNLLGDLITGLKTVVFKFQNTVKKKVAILMFLNYIANCLDVNTQNIRNC